MAGNGESTVGYQRFLNWAEKDPTNRRILSEQEYNDRVGKFRIRLSPIEQLIQQYEKEAGQQYNILMATIAKLRETMAKYQESIERELTR